MVDSEGAPTLSLAYLRAGPFISGTTHAVLQLGQRPRQTRQEAVQEEAGTSDADYDGGGQAARRPGKQDRTQHKGKRGKAGVQVRDLVDCGLLVPGKAKLTVSYKGVNYTAALLSDGLIQFQGIKFSSATAFSIHCKRLQTPSKMGDDGWKSVLYDGTPLDAFRRKYETVRHATPVRASEEAEREDSEVPISEGGTPAPAAAADAQADQWVQCERCKTWRLVPPERWPAVEADEREEWLCEYADWPVAAHAPHTPACTSAG